MKFSGTHPPVTEAEERLARAFAGNGLYNAIFLGVTALGFLVIYGLTLFNVFGAPTPQLLYISGAILLLAVLQLPLLALARQNRGIATTLLAAAFVGLFAVLLTAFWDRMLWLALAIVIVTPLFAILSGLPRRYYLPILLIALAAGAAAYYLDANPRLDRMPATSPASVASLAFLATTGILFVAVTVFARSQSYRSLRSQLLVSFLIIVTVPTLLATLLSAVGAYVNNENQTFRVLETVANLKESQITNVLDSLEGDAARLSQDLTFARNSLTVLQAGPEDSDSSLATYRNLARERLLAFQGFSDQLYAELTVLNAEGVAVISTDAEREGRSYESEAFFTKGLAGPAAGFSRNPAFGQANLIFAVPMQAEAGGTVRGVLVLRAKSDPIRAIMEATPALAEMETYLLERRLDNTLQGAKISLQPLTGTRSTPPTFNTPALLRLLNRANDSGSSVYGNYAGQPVLGYYRYVPSLEAYIIAEIPRTYILQNSVRSLLGSAALAAFAIIIAIAAVVITAGSIAEPISALARAAESFSEGRLSSRVAFRRRDELGALGKAYDQMAEQLQDVIGRLEQRVADRTRELQDQTLRLRTAAEIARDAASAHTLSELLDKAGQLIQERFHLYHTGIFLLDKNNEYAVLTASPTLAGQQMIASQHQLRVGEVGIVGRVAATGQPRLTLDTGADAVHFNNPLLPATRSEMALPLKVENHLIGVLDIQSDQPQAFDENDLAILQILADQLATAIERTRLLQQVEESLSDLEQAYGQFTRESWKTLAESGLLSKAGYRFDNVRIQPIAEISALGNQALQTGDTLIDNVTGPIPRQNEVALPIKLRGQTIGVVTATLKEGYPAVLISTLELAIERLALSLESARLYEEARLRADRERVIAQVASTISSTTEFDAILRTTVEEVGKSLSDAEVSIQILSSSEAGPQ